MSEVDSGELRKFASSTISNIESGLKEQGYQVAGAIEFELAVAKSKEKGAGLRIYVVDASAKHNKEVVSRIKFQVVPKDSRFGRALRRGISQ